MKKRAPKKRVIVHTGLQLNPVGGWLAVYISISVHLGIPGCNAGIASQHSTASEYCI